jgi:hypothetical protein
LLRKGGRKSIAEVRMFPLLGSAYFKHSTSICVSFAFGHLRFAPVVFIRGQILNRGMH